MRHNFEHKAISGESGIMLASYKYFCSTMSLFLKTVRSVCNFCQKLALEYTKVMKVGIFLELDTLDSDPVHFGITERLITS